MQGNISKKGLCGMQIQVKRPEEPLSELIKTVVNIDVGWCNSWGTCRLRGQPPEVHPAKPSCRLNSQKRGWECSRGEEIALGEAGGGGGGGLL